LPRLSTGGDAPHEGKTLGPNLTTPRPAKLICGGAGFFLSPDSEVGYGKWADFDVAFTNLPLFEFQLQRFWKNTRCCQTTGSASANRAGLSRGAMRLGDLNDLKRLHAKQKILRNWASKAR